VAGLWENRTAEYVLDSLRDARTNERMQYEQECANHLAFYAGGSDLASKLVRHSTESVADFERRRQRFVSMNYTTPMGDQIINGLYGPPVERHIENDDAGQKVFEAIWKVNNIHRKMIDGATNTVITGDNYVRSYWDIDLKTVRYAVLDSRNILPIPKGDDAEQLEALMEDRSELLFTADGRLQTIRRGYIFTKDLFTEFMSSADGKSSWFVVRDKAGDVKPVDVMQPNPYKTIPYAHWKGRSLPGQYSGLSLIRDAVTIQAEINNRTSALTVLVTMQGFATLVIKGRTGGTLTLKEHGYIEIDEDGDALYLQPNAPIDEVQGSIEFLIKGLFETGAVPISAIRGGTASSGLQLAMELKPLSDIVGRLKTQAIESERDLFNITRIIHNTYGTPKISERAEFIPDFPETFLPQDKIAEMMNDLTLVNNTPPLMSREQFWKKHNPDLSDDQIKKLAQEIDMSFAESRRIRGSLLPPRAGFVAAVPTGEEE